MFIDKLEINLIQKVSDRIFDTFDSQLVCIDEILEAFENLKCYNNEEAKYEFCSALETLYYCFSVVLSDVRQNKREIMTALFQQNPKLAQEKSVLKDKLDAEPEYAKMHQLEEQLFQLVEHIQNIKNNVIYLYKEFEDSVE